MTRHRRWATIDHHHRLTAPVYVGWSGGGPHVPPYPTRNQRTPNTSTQIEARGAEADEGCMQSRDPNPRQQPGVHGG